MKILTVIGARPQFIKAAAFSNELKSFPNDEQVKRIPKTDEFMKALQTMRLFEKQEPVNYEVTCKK